MNRWLLVSCCVLVLAAIAYIEPTRARDAKALGGECSSDRDCQLGLSCTRVAGVMESQCSAVCNSTPSCQERFGRESMCLGADVCARTCGNDTGCAEGGSCNAYGWCESEP